MGQDILEQGGGLKRVSVGPATYCTVEGAVSLVFEFTRRACDGSLQRQAQ